MRFNALLAWAGVVSASGTGLGGGMGGTAFGQNQPPAAPVITEPLFDGRVVNASDVHMETGPFSDPDAGDEHLCTDWEVWTIDPPELVWLTSCIGGVERVHTHIGDGQYMGSHAGMRNFMYSTNYKLRVRHRDSSGGENSWSEYSERLFTTAPPTAINPMMIADVASTPAPVWRFGQQPVIFGGAKPPAFLNLENGLGEPLVQIRSLNQNANQVIDSEEMPSHHAVRVRVSAGGLKENFITPETELYLPSADGEERTIYLPIIALAPGQEVTYWVASSGATYVGNASQTEPDFTTLARSAPVPWVAKRGYRVEVVASGLQLPVNIAFVPDPLPGADAPIFYVTELYGTIKVMLRNGKMQDFATNLLNFTATGNFPGSGEQGLAGIVVEPGTRQVYATLLYEAADGSHFPKVVRFNSADGGRTASGQTTLLDMFGELQGQSHQISSISFGPDEKLYVHMGDGFHAHLAMNLNWYRGKILRMNRDGSAAADNPFYDSTNGINARDYVFAYGLRNPFGGCWRLSDGRLFQVENGPSIDRFARVERGVNYGFDGSSASMEINALHTWSPVTAPVNIAFVEPAVFGGSGFPPEQYGKAFITFSGPTYLGGTTPYGKQVAEVVLDENGDYVRHNDPLVTYNGAGRATACGLAAGPDGLYFTDLYEDSGANGPAAIGSNVLRIRYVGVAGFTADVRRGPGPLAVKFTDRSEVPDAHTWEWDFGDGTRSNERHPVHVYTKPGEYNVRLAVTGVGDPVVSQRNEYVVVAPGMNAAYIGGDAAPTAADAQVIAALEAEGYTVAYFDDNGAGRPRGEALAEGRNVVVVSSTMSAAAVLTEFRDVRTPVLFWEPTMLYQAHEGLATSSAVLENRTQVNVVDTSHPVTHGLMAGETDVYAKPALMYAAAGTYGPGMTVLARSSGDEAGVALGAVETGEEVLGGRTAASRRVFIFLGDSSFERLTPEGLELFKRSVCWLTGRSAEVLSEPADATAAAGEDVVLRVLARGDGELSYQWRKDGEAIDGATSATLTLIRPALRDAGVYDVVVTNGCGGETSAGATVTVLCTGDYNRDGVVSTQDFFEFLLCFFEAGCDADFDGDGAVSSQDFFDFMSAFFAPCG